MTSCGSGAHAPGVDEVRIKADETNLMRPDRGHAAGGLEASLPLSLARSDVREAQRRRVSVLPELHARRRAGGQRGHGNRWTRSGTASRCSTCGGCTLAKRAGEIDVCAKCCTTIPHPALVAGSLLLHGRTVRTLLAVGGTAGLLLQAARSGC